MKKLSKVLLALLILISIYAIKQKEMKYYFNISR